MKRLKINLVLILCACSFAAIAWQPAFAYEAPEHDDLLEMVLLGKDVSPAKKNVELNMLEKASYLCIDQWNGKGEEELNYLRGNGFPLMLRPFGIGSIEQSYHPGNHRSYTHCGWTKGYYERLFIGREGDRKDWERCWEKRKGILRDVSAMLFGDESLLGWLPFTPKPDGEKVEYFCELVYYVHVLGDYLHDKDGSAFTGSRINGYKIPFASAHGEQDIFSELKKCFEGLFKNQSKEPEYRSLMRDLDSLANEARGFASTREESYDTTEDYEIVHSYAEKLMAMLMGSSDRFDRDYGYSEKRISRLLMMDPAFKEKFGKL